MVCEDERVSAKVGTRCMNLKRTRFLPDETPSMSEMFLALFAIPLSTQMQQGWVERPNVTERCLLLTKITEFLERFLHEIKHTLLFRSFQRLSVPS